MWKRYHCPGLSGRENRGNMKRVFAFLLAALLLAGCGSRQPRETETYPVEAEDELAAMPEFYEEEEAEVMPFLQIEIGSHVLLASFAETAAAAELMQKLEEGPFPVSVSNYGGWEKVGQLPFSLPASDTRLDAQPGDIMLYTGDQIVLFYGENTWSYTRLGVIDAQSDELKAALSGHENQITLSLVWQ